MVEWFRGAETALIRAEAPTTNLQKLRRQLQDHKSLNDEIVHQKSKTRDLASASKKLMQETSGDDLENIRQKSEQMKELNARVIQLSSDRLALLEEALPLSEQFEDLHNDLSRWLSELEQKANKQEAPALSADQIKKQQDANKVLTSSIFLCLSYT